MLTDLLSTLASFLPRPQRQAIGFSYSVCIAMRVHPCKLARNAEHDAELSRVLATRHTHLGEIELFDPSQNLYIYLDFRAYQVFEMSITTRIFSTSVHRPTYTVESGSQLRSVMMWGDETREHTEIVDKQYTLEALVFPRYVIHDGKRVVSSSYWLYAQAV